MKNKKVSYRSLEIFNDLNTYGSFTETAKVLNISKAAVSHAIKQLELELKVELLIRTTRTIALTDEGKLLLDHCKNLKKEVDNIRNLSESFHKEPSGSLKISTNSFFAKNTLLKLIKKYSAIFPKVKVQVFIEERMPNIKANEIDIVFGVNWQPPEDIIARKIASTKYVLCASPQYLKRKGTPKNLQELVNHDYIAHSSRSSPLVATKSEIKLTTKKFALSADNIGFIKECVINDLGIAQFHDYIVKEEISKGTLIEILSEEFHDYQDLFIYYQKNKFVQPKVKSFVNLALDNKHFF